MTEPVVSLQVAKELADEVGQLRADRDRLAAELEAVQQALFGYGHGSLVDRVNTITAREVEYVERAGRLAARVRELEAALAENARLRAANKRLAELLGHVLKNGRLEDDEMADARAALGRQAADSGEEA